MAKFIKWGAIALLVVAVAFLSFQWGQTVAERDAEERRREAVQEAVRAANEKARVRVQEAEKRAQTFYDRLSQAREELDALDSRVSDYEGGEEQCLPPDALELYNSY